MGFRGPDANRVDAAFEAMMVSHRSGGEPYFTVVDRHETQAVMGEQARSLRGEVDPRTAAKFGKQMGAEGVYFGDVLVSDVTSRRYTSEQSYCMRYSSSGRKCRDWGKRNVSCQERTATVTLAPRLVSVDTGQVVYRSQQSGQASSSGCGESPSVPDVALVEQAMGQTMGRILAEIAPTETVTQVRLMDQPSALDPPSTKEFARGMMFANEDRMDRACQIWGDLNDAVTGADNALLFNVAVCRETRGDYAGALRAIEEVDRRLSQPDPNVTAALRRLQQSLGVE